jgi:kynureninase
VSSAQAPAAFDRRRDEFPALRTGIHLLSHSLGPAPRAARSSVAATFDQWEGQIAEDAWGRHWWDLPRQVGDRIARVLGGAPGSVQVQPNTSTALAAAISCFDFAAGRRRRVVTGGLDFPTTAYIWEAQRRAGAEIVVVPSDDGLTLDADRVADAIDETTALVALSHVSYLSSHRIDPRPIIEAAHRSGAMVLLDVYQSAGVLELAAADWGVDFLVGGTIKWLCGGPACGYLYVRPDLVAGLEPRLTGWFAHARPFDFAAAPIRYDAGIRRFAQGTPPIASLASCLAGLDLVLEVGPGAIESESRRRTTLMIDMATERGWRVNTPRDPRRRGGVVMLGFEDAATLVERLRAQRVLADHRPGVGLRLSAHFFNTDDEVREAFAILDRLAGRRA